MTGRHAPRSKTGKIPQPRTKWGTNRPSGCFTCRIRKLKCDSVQPCCTRCKKAQISCEWRFVARCSRAKPLIDQTSSWGARPLRRLLPSDTGSRVSAPSFSLDASHICLANSLRLRDVDRQYLAFVPYTTLVHSLGKSWKWGCARYLHSNIARDSPTVMMMLLAISANEFDSRQLGEGHKLWGMNTGTGYYTEALRRFSTSFNNREFQSAKTYNEDFAVFFLMLYYEHQFGTDPEGFKAHIRGFYAFFRAYCSAGSLIRKGLERLPILSQQLLLYIIYLHLHIVDTDTFTLKNWEDANFEKLAGIDMDQVFRETRNAHSILWGQDYPAEEIIDDMSVFRPLELYHECNKFKCKMIRVLRVSTPFIGPPVSHQALRDELEYIGKIFSDLITLAKRTEFSLRKRELYTNYLAVAEYHALSLMCQKALCVSEGPDRSYSQAVLVDLISVSEKAMQQKSQTFARLSWPFLIAAESLEGDTYRQWIIGEFERFHHETGSMSWMKFKLDRRQQEPRS
ncbi:hypothetical protein F1880_009953 [Penicillium rolfsii]|nr:hypothetical protein F1880_009953 [Penicillium rolfsii]